MNITLDGKPPEIIFITIEEDKNFILLQVKGFVIPFYKFCRDKGRLSKIEAMEVIPTDSLSLV